MEPQEPLKQSKKEHKLVAVVGPTASGKSVVAMQIAQEHGGEIICADSRTVYRGMNIGTAKPSTEDQAKVPHHLLDVVNPDENFTVADFQKRANEAIKDIQNRGKLPVLVGGTGLYVDAVLYDFSLRPTAGSKADRAKLEKLSVEALQKRLRKQGLELPENVQNKRHLIRLLETNGMPSKKQRLRPNTLVLGFLPSDEVLKARIAERVDQMFAQGLEAEVKSLSNTFGWKTEAMKGIGYQEWPAYFAGEQTLTETKELIVRHTWQYVRRQKTWFKRNPDIIWNH